VTVDGVKEKSVTDTCVAPPPPGRWACPESGSIISEEASTASNWPAGTDFSSSRTSFDHPVSEAPPKNQFDPLSVRMRP